MWWMPSNCALGLFRPRTFEVLNPSAFKFLMYFFELTSMPKVCYFCNTIIDYEYFQTGQLNEYTERKDMSADVKCMSLASVPAGEQRARFLAVGLDDNTVRIISLDQSVSRKFFTYTSNKLRLLINISNQSP